MEGMERRLLTFLSDSTGTGAAAHGRKMGGRLDTARSAASPGHTCPPQASSWESSRAPALRADSSFRDGTEESGTTCVGIYSVCNAEEKRCSLGTGLYF